MSSKTTRILFAIALAMLAYIFLVERKGLTTDSKALQARRVFQQLRPDAVSMIEVTLSNQVTRIEFATEGWRIITPSPYPAQRTLVEGFLDALANLDRVSSLSAKEVMEVPQGLAGFGLEPPVASVLVVQGDLRQEIRFGHPTVVGGRVYARLLGQDGILIVDTSILEKLPENTFAWRDRRLVGQRASGVDGFEIRRKGLAPMELRRDLASLKWRIVAPIQARGDSIYVNELLELLQSSNADRFFPDASMSELESFGLRPAELELALKKGTNEISTLRFGKALTNDVNFVYAQIAEGRGVVAVDKVVTDILKAPIAQYRDKHLISVPKEAVTRVEIDALENFVLERRQDSNWWVMTSSPFLADPGLVEAAIQRLASLSIVEFLSDAVVDYSPFGLARPSRKFRLFAGPVSGAQTNQLLAEVHMGTNLVDRIIARRADEGSVYSAPLAEVLRLPHAAFQVRDRRILQYSVTNLTGVTFRQKGNTFGLARSQNGSWSLPKEYQGKLELSAVLEILHRLGQVEVMSWIGRGDELMKRLGFEESGYELRIETLVGSNPSLRWLRFGRRTPSGNVYAAVSIEGEWIVFEFPTSIFTDVTTFLTVPGASK